MYRHERRSCSNAYEEYWMTSNKPSKCVASEISSMDNVLDPRVAMLIPACFKGELWRLDKAIHIAHADMARFPRDNLCNVLCVTSANCLWSGTVIDHHPASLLAGTLVRSHGAHSSNMQLSAFPGEISIHHLSIIPVQCESPSVSCRFCLGISYLHRQH